MLSSPYEKVPIIRRNNAKRDSPTRNVNNGRKDNHLSVLQDVSIDSYGFDKKQQRLQKLRARKGLLNKCRYYCLYALTLSWIIKPLANCWHALLIHFIPPADDQKYYEDLYPTHSFTCTAGTGERHGVWLNARDRVGLLMSGLVWLFYFYSICIFAYLAIAQRLSLPVTLLYISIVALALACHVKTTLTDPGSVPTDAVPTVKVAASSRHKVHVLCSTCQAYKPPLAHHCRICNRCVARMDHHCPWMNNCIGAGNMKHFALFLLYTWSASAYSLTVLGYNYFTCSNATCEFTKAQAPLVYALTYMALAALLFTTSMLLNVIFGILTGLGTIDRLYGSNGTGGSDHYDDFISTMEPLSLQNIFGSQGYWTWPWPVDPVFEDYSLVMGYTTRQALLRLKETASDGDSSSSNNNDVFGNFKSEHDYNNIHSTGFRGYSSDSDDEEGQTDTVSF